MRRHTLFAPSSPTMDAPPTLPLPEFVSDHEGEPVALQPTRDSSISRPDSPPIQEETNKHRRFSVLRFRNASDSQLSLRAKQQSEKPPPIPRRTSSPSALRCMQFADITNSPRNHHHRPYQRVQWPPEEALPHEPRCQVPSLDRHPP